MCFNLCVNQELRNFLPILDIVSHVQYTSAVDRPPSESALIMTTWSSYVKSSVFITWQKFQSIPRKAEGEILSQLNGELSIRVDCRWLNLQKQKHCPLLVKFEHYQISTTLWQDSFKHLKQHKHIAQSRNFLSLWNVTVRKLNNFNETLYLMETLHTFGKYSKLRKMRNK